jgi:hypothetical protein
VNSSFNKGKKFIVKKIATLTLTLLSAVQGMETTTTIPSVPNDSQKPYEPSTALNKPWFEETLSDFEAYQTHSTPELKHKIVMDLNHLMLSGELEEEEKEEAIEIAESLNAHNLKVRLDAYNQDENMQGFHILPPDALHLIIEEVLKGGSIENIKTLLHTSKDFNLSLLSSPISLDLSPLGAKVTDQTLAQIVEIFPNMRNLNLRGCYKITDAGLVHLKDLTKLTYLNLVNCWHITDAGLEYLKDLTHLTKLNLVNCWHITDCNITDAGLVHLSRLTHLTELNLWGCRKITDAGLVHLSRLTHLTKLNLGWCSITNAGLVHLKDLTNLTFLGLAVSENITDAAIDELRNALPNLEISW